MIEIKNELDDTTLKVQVIGSIDTVSAPEFESAVIPALENADKVVFDFSDLEIITSAGLRVLLNIHKHIDGNVPIRGAHKEVIEVLDITGFKPFFKLI